ncbi:DUF433 domain-containing protein [Nocardioides lentus]|uniref:DUF433 domain-containing protein n=1 Tax=Nocardioides lentus TaxID=338077 RepID=UPI0031D95B01
MDTNRAMYTHPRLAELAGVSVRRLSYWESQGLLRPTSAMEMRGRNVRLYDFHGALTALILAALREKVSLQHIRQVVRHLRERDFDVPSVRFALVGPRVFFQTPEGEWEDVRDPMQIVISETLDLRPLRATLARGVERTADQHGQVEKLRGARGSRPLVSGTRVPVAAVERYLRRGIGTDRILEAYPSLTTEDIEAVRAVSA